MPLSPIRMVIELSLCSHERIAEQTGCNPAIASRFQSRRHWRGVAKPERQAASQAMTLRPLFCAVLVALIGLGCANPRSRAVDTMLEIGFNELRLDLTLAVSAGLSCSTGTIQDQAAAERATIRFATACSGASRKLAIHTFRQSKGQTDEETSA